MMWCTGSNAKQQSKILHMCCLHTVSLTMCANLLRICCRFSCTEYEHLLTICCRFSSTEYHIRSLHARPARAISLWHRCTAQRFRKRAIMFANKHCKSRSTALWLADSVGIFKSHDALRVLRSGNDGCQSTFRTMCCGEGDIQIFRASEAPYFFLYDPCFSDQD